MRKPTYISPTSYRMWRDNVDEYYLKYLAEVRPPRLMQTMPMAIGSAFDAYVKAYMSRELFGEVRPGFDLDELFEKQVELQNRDWARGAGKYAFDCYLKSGAMLALMVELETAESEPRFEFTIQGDIAYSINLGISGGENRTVEGVVPLLGKPDLYYVTVGGSHIVYDFKVNGFCGNSATSPKPGFTIIRDGWDHDDYKPSRGEGRAHKNCTLTNVDGILINENIFFEDISDDWAVQLTIYGWELGVPVEEPFVAGIEQLVAKPIGEEYPLIRVASHRAIISQEYQRNLCLRLHAMWSSIQSGYIFTDRTREESDAHCAVLDERYKAFGDEDDPREAWFTQATRQADIYKGK